jgi:hypothetical protein
MVSTCASRHTYLCAHQQHGQRSRMLVPNQVVCAGQGIKHTGIGVTTGKQAHVPALMQLASTRRSAKSGSVLEQRGKEL